MTFVASVTAIALSGGPELIIAGVLAALAFLGVGIAVLRRGRSKARAELPTVEVPQLADRSGKPEPTTRAQVDGPVEIDKKMSLAEIKAAKSALLTHKFKNSDEAQAEITRRKTGGVPSLSSDEDTPLHTQRPLAVTPVAPTPVAPGASDEAPTAPQTRESAAELIVDEVEAAAREAETTQAPAIAVVDVPESVGDDVPDEAPSPGNAGGNAENAEAPSDADSSAVDAAAIEAEDVVAEPASDESRAPEVAVPDTVETASESESAPLVQETPGEVPAAAAVQDDAPPEPAAPLAIVEEAAPVEEEVAERTQPVALSDGLAKTRGGLFKRLGSLFTSKQALDDDLFEELEELLFTADIGVKTCQYLLDRVQQRHDDGEVGDAETAYRVLREEMSAVLHRHTRHLEVARDAGPQVWLMVGVNGAGKTTTVGKLAAQLMAEGHSVLMVAGDTFRAAAVGQLERWADRVGCGFHNGADEADPSSVIFDGVQRAKAEGFDIVLCDTAGRLQTKTPLMDELSKIGRVAGKALDGAPHETILVVDANTGQNAIQQARLFGDAVPLTGMILTKLDGTAKGGVVLGISQELDVPIYHIGIGEGIADLRRFDADEFVEALFM